MIILVLLIESLMLLWCFRARARRRSQIATYIMFVACDAFVIAVSGVLFDGFTRGIPENRRLVAMWLVPLFINGAKIGLLFGLVVGVGIFLPQVNPESTASN